MGIFSSAPKKRSSDRAVLNKLNRRLEKRKKAEAKKKEKARVRTQIVVVRKKLRGY